MNDIHGLLTPSDVQEQLSDLAEACLEAAVAVATERVREQLGPSPGRFAVVGMGKLGGRELNYNSDLDLIFVWDASPGASGEVSPGEYFTKLAQRLLSVLQMTTREGFAYRIDTRLRPSGSQGPLVSSLESFREYHRTSSHVWERQALIRARVVAGEPELGAAVQAIVEEFVYGKGLDGRRARRDRAPARAHGARDRARDADPVEPQDGPRRPRRRRVRRADAAAPCTGTTIPSIRSAASRPRSRRSIANTCSRTTTIRRLRRRLRLPAHVESRLRLESEQAVEAIELDDPDLEPLARSSVSRAPAKRRGARFVAPSKASASKCERSTPRSSKAVVTDGLQDRHSTKVE